MNELNEFLRRDDGGNLAEYVILFAFVFIASLAMFIASGSDVQRIWSSLTNMVLNSHRAGAR